MEEKLTIAKDGTSDITIEKSRFICHITRVKTKEEAEAFFDTVRSEHKDATHNVPCYIVGGDGAEKWSSEDGEPQGTAGAPVLRMLEVKGLTDVACVVTRYFGGVKLGTGGLVRAYTRAAEMALNDAGIARFEMRDVVRVRTDYKTYSKISSHNFNGACEVENATFDENVSFDLIIKRIARDNVLAMLRATAGREPEIVSEDARECQIKC